MNVVRTKAVLSTIMHAVEDLDMPAPRMITIGEDDISIGFHAPAEVSRWATYLGTPPGQGPVLGSFVSTEFAGIDDHGWCGARVVHLSAPMPDGVVVAP